MYSGCRLSGNHILNYFACPRGTIWWVEYPGLEHSRNVPKERLVRLYLNIYPQNVPTAQNTKVNALSIE